MVYLVSLKVVVLPFSLAGFTIDHVRALDGKLIIGATATCLPVACPDCRQPSSRVHSRYVRMPRDVPVSDQHVQLHLSVRRFFCDTPTCPRRTFAERRPELVPFRAQRTQRFTQSLRVLGFAEGGRAAARTATHLGLSTSRNTMLRVIRQSVLPTASTPRVLGVDDFALRKGHVYGTIFVDLEQRRPVDLLPDRDAELIETWLKAHPGVVVVSRDRSTEYIRGITAGAPEAIQVADRWHLLSNLREALERMLDRVHARLRERVVLPPPVVEDGQLAPPPTIRPRRRSVQEEAARATRRDRRFARYTAVVERYDQGMSMRQIATELHLSRWQVQRFLKAHAFPEQGPRWRRSQILRPFEALLNAQWAAGERNAMALWRTLTAQGYTGSAQTIRRWAQQHRQEPAARTRTAYRATYTIAADQVPSMVAATRRLPAPRQLVWLLLRDPEHVTADDTAMLTQLRQEAVVDTAYTLAQQFLQIIRERQPDQLDAWLAACHASGSADLRGFATGLVQDEAAVRAALTQPWSNGQVEGQVNRLKMLKRQMYGRASFDLLRQRVLYAA